MDPGYLGVAGKRKGRGTPRSNDPDPTKRGHGQYTTVAGRQTVVSMNLHESIVCIKALAEWRRRNINSSYRHAAQSAQDKILSQVREALDGVAVQIQRAATGEE